MAATTLTSVESPSADFSQSEVTAKELPQGKHITRTELHGMQLQHTVEVVLNKEGVRREIKLPANRNRAGTSCTVTPNGQSFFASSQKHNGSDAAILAADGQSILFNGSEDDKPIGKVQWSSQYGKGVSIRTFNGRQLQDDETRDVYEEILAGLGIKCRPLVVLNKHDISQLGAAGAGLKGVPEKPVEASAKKGRAP